MFGRLIVKKTRYCLKSPLSANYQIFIPHPKRQLQHRAATGAAGAARQRSLPREVISIPSLLPGWGLPEGRILTPLPTRLANGCKSKCSSVTKLSKL